MRRWSTLVLRMIFVVLTTTLLLACGWNWENKVVVVWLDFFTFDPERVVAMEVMCDTSPEYTPLRSGIPETDPGVEMRAREVFSSPESRYGTVIGIRVKNVQSDLDACRAAYPSGAARRWVTYVAQDNRHGGRVDVVVGQAVNGKYPISVFTGFYRRGSSSQELYVYSSPVSLDDTWTLPTNYRVSTRRLIHDTTIARERASTGTPVDPPIYPDF